MTPQEYKDFWGAPNTENFSNNKAGVYDTFNQLFGRPPTKQEAAQFLPYFGNDPHTPNMAAGGSAISAYFQQQNQPTAEDIYQKQQQKYQDQSGQYAQPVMDQFQSLLGRAATQDELKHFGTLMASGQTDQYELGNYLKQTQEYQTTQDTAFRQNLSGQLNDVNSQFFKQYIQPSVVSQFASQGRDVSGASTGLQFALANAAKEMQTQTQGYLANLSAGQYAQNKGNARSDYEAQLGQAYGLQNAGVGNTLSQQNALFGNSLGMANYGVQSQDMMNYLRANRPGGSPLQSSLSGAMSGAAAGGSVGGPWGAVAGGIGGGLFGYGAGGGFSGH